MGTIVVGGAVAVVVAEPDVGRTGGSGAGVEESDELGVEEGGGEEGEDVEEEVVDWGDVEAVAVEIMEVIFVMTEVEYMGSVD